MNADSGYFSGLTFALGGTRPKHVEWHRHTPTYYGIQYNHTGTLHLRINHRATISKQGPCAFITHPGAYFEYGAPSGTSRHHNFICFFGERIKTFIDGGLMDLSLERPLVHISHPQRFFQKITEIIQGIDNQGTRRVSIDRMTLLVEDLLLEVAEGSAESEEGMKRKDWDILELISEIEQVPEKSWSFQDEAKRRNITLEHLRRLFGKAIGIPPQQYLLQQRLRLAAELLVSSKDLISEIGQKVGIADEYYFSRLFKQRYTLSPSKYRNEFAAHFQS